MKDAASRRRNDSRYLVLNPTSGTENHTEQVRSLAAERGFDVGVTEGRGDAAKLARNAVRDGATLIAACGGDGTVNEVVDGLYAADALDGVTVGVVPTGTGNNFASNVGVRSIDHAFDVLETGRRRRIDVGVANGRVFVNSCLGGITAEASSETTVESKRKLGVMAYVVNTLKFAVNYEGLSLAVETSDAAERSWSGETVFVLVGNGRRFPVEGRTQANMEDGLFDVTIIEEAPAIDLAGEAALEQLLGRSGEHIHRLLTPELTVTSIDGEPVTFSLDGEITSERSVEIETVPGALTFAVGEAYEPDPE